MAFIEAFREDDLFGELMETFGAPDSSGYVPPAAARDVPAAADGDKSTVPGPGETDYREIADQVYNLVDNRRNAVSSFKTAIGDRTALNGWFKSNVKQKELTDLFDPSTDQSVEGFMDWIDEHPGYFSEEGEDSAEVVDTSVGDSSIASTVPDTSAIISNINREDNELLGVEDDGSDDGSDDGAVPDSSVQAVLHRRPVRKVHTLNKVVVRIDDDEAAERMMHEKYYILTPAELSGVTADAVEDRLDGMNISYYDFPNGKLKIFSQNEVELNRMFESLGMGVRCINIRHYTEKEIAGNKVKAAQTRASKDGQQ